jgi:fascin 1/2
VTANQRFDITDTEIFQMEFDPKKPGKVCMLANTREYWIANGDVKATSSDRVDTAFFGIDWHGSHVSFQAASDKYVTIKPNGKLAPTSESVGDKEKFLLQLINRPLLILRGEHGFVGMRGPSTARLECNRSSYEVFKLHFEDGKYKLEGRNGKFAQIDGEANLNLSGTSEDCATFQLEFREHTKMCIKANNGKYLKGESNGAFTANGEKLAKNTLWEY